MANDRASQGTIGDDPPRVRFRCPTCGVRYEIPVRVTLSFPDDADGIVDLLAARLNVQPCEACGRTLSPQPSLAVVNTLTGDAAVAGASSELVSALQTFHADHPEAEFHVVAGYVELHAIVLEWADAYMIRATASLFTGDAPERDADGIPLPNTPLALLVLHEQVEGRLKPRLITDPPVPEERQRRMLAGLYVAHVRDVLGFVYQEAFRGDGLSALPALVERRIPARCLTDAVLAETLAPCKGWDTALLHDSEEFSTRLRAEYINATAHTIAGKPNPRGRAWARFAKVLFALDRNPQVELPASVRLSADALERTITFEEAWDTAVAELSDAGTVDVAGAWFEHLGMEERFREHMEAIPVAMDFSALTSVSDEEVAGRFLAGLHEDTDARRVQVTGLARGAIRAGRPGIAQVMFERELDRLADQHDSEALAGQTIRAMQALRDVGEQEVATALLGRHLDELTDATLDPAQRLGVLAEIGNAARYARDYPTALRAYDAALAVAADEPDGSAGNVFVVRRNVAIVQRELGRYSDAVRILDELERESRGESSARRARVLASLALAYLDAELPGRALPLAQEAYDIPLSPAEAPLRATVLLAYAGARAHTEDSGTLDEYVEALELTSPTPALHASAAAWIVKAASSGRVPVEALQRAEAVLEDSAAADGQGLSDRSATAIALLAEHRLDAGDRAAAHRLLAPLEEHGLTAEQLPWQLNLLVGRLREDTDPDRALNAMRAALQELDGSVPESSGLAFATPWIGGRAGAQGHIARVYHHAIARGAAHRLEYLDLADFVYARDVPGPEDLEKAAPTERLAALAATLPGDVDVTLVTFLEQGEDVVALAVDPREPEPQLEQLSTPRAEILAAARRFARAVGPSCILPEQKQRAEARIGGVLADVGRMLRTVAPPGHQICVVPSPALVGLPLHAATAGDVPLLDRNAIATAPSLRTLHRALAAAGARGPRPGTIIAVPKEGDSEPFRALLEDAATALRKGLEPLATRTLSDRAATKDAVLAAFGSSEQVIFLGHGAEGASLYGRGLCVSDGIDLPRGPLPVDLIPQLRRYVVDAADLERAEASPAVLVSMACSSGRARPGPGGTRIGLERSMFTNGAQTIVAPLWDVAQEPALELILTMMASWRGSPDLTLGEHHRLAALAVREGHPLVFDWASFALNGSFI